MCYVCVCFVFRCSVLDELEIVNNKQSKYFFIVLSVRVRDMKGSSLKKRLELRSQALQRDAVLDPILNPQRHSSAFHVSLLNGAGECDHRLTIRERYAFHNETMKPKKLPPVVRQVQRDHQSSFDSLRSVYCSFQPKFSTLFKAEKDRRKLLERESFEAFENAIKDSSRMINIEAIVRPEVAASLGLTMSITLPNYLEVEQQQFASQKSNLFKAEASQRGSLSHSMVRDIAALRRMALRRLKALSTEEEAAKQAAILEAQQEAERRWQRREAQFIARREQIREEENTNRYVVVELTEFADRRSMELAMNQIWCTAIRDADYTAFMELMTSHFALVALEKQFRDTVEADERSAFALIRAEIAEADRMYNVYQVGLKLERLVANEATLRPRREAIALRLCASRVVEGAVLSLYVAYEATLARALSLHLKALAATPLHFLAFCEAEERRVVEEAYDRFYCEHQEGLQSSSIAQWTEVYTRRRLCDTPTSDMHQPQEELRSLVPSRQLSGRRPLVSAGGAPNNGGSGLGGRSSRVPTSEGQGRPPASGTTSSRATPIPSVVAKMDL